LLSCYLIYAVRSAVNHYTMNGSTVNLCATDISYYIFTFISPSGSNIKEKGKNLYIVSQKKFPPLNSL